MEKHLENILNRYVIATFDVPTRYLVFKNNNISFTNNIALSTKTASKSVAKSIKEEFYSYTGARDIQLVVLPLVITYELIQEGLSAIKGDINDIS